MVYGVKRKSQKPLMNDKYDRLRYIGYCWSKLPPDDDNVEFDDFVNYAKFQLCIASHKLVKDPIWDEYSSEEILIEYYALLYHNNKEQADVFLKNIKGVSNDYDWILEQEENSEDLLGDDSKDSVVFNPKELGE